MESFQLWIERVKCGDDRTTNSKEWKVMHIRGGEHNANNNNENREIRPQNIKQRIKYTHRTKHEERRE